MWNPPEAAAFSGSTSHREYADEEEKKLRWAAIERLPSFSRIRRGIIRREDGEFSDVDVSNLTSREQTALIDRLLGDSGNHERFFQRIRQRFDAVNLEFPKIEVRYQELKVDTYAYTGSRALPTIPNFICNMTEVKALVFASKLFCDTNEPLLTALNLVSLLLSSKVTCLPHQHHLLGI